MPRRADGLINTAAACTWLAANVIRQRQHGTKTTAAASPSLVQARVRKTVAQAKLVEHRARLLAASLTDTQQIRLAWAAHVAHVRTVLLALPQQLAAQCAAASDVLAVQALLDRAIRSTLTELSNYKQQNQEA